MSENDITDLLERVGLGAEQLEPMPDDYWGPFEEGQKIETSSLGQLKISQITPDGRALLTDGEKRYLFPRDWLEGQKSRIRAHKVLES
ncbi:hypothetical protein ACFQJD_18595 [Haloplanus sp. GCM10025708]|uniref:hypothetical protein n=1 Tax=Haloferacaceae TaxID=1644056 RepID=UPI0036239953